MVISGRMVAMGLAALLLGGAGIAVAATRDPDTKVASGAPEPVNPQPEVTTSSTAPPSTTSTSPPTTQVEVPSTTARRATTTTVARSTTTTGLRASTTSTISSNMPCTAAQIAVAATTDKATYGPTEQVKLESTLRNRSSTACSYTGYTFRATFSDPAGRPIIDSAQIADAFRPTALVPGAVLTATTPFDQRTCQMQPCPPMMPGTYSATATWTFPGGPFEVRAPFAFTA